MVLLNNQDNDKFIVRFLECDRIDTTNLKLIKEQLQPIINDINDSNNCEESVFDFDNINFIDSSGLAMIINVYKKLLENDKKLVLINVNDVIENIFNITKVNTFVEVIKR